MVNFEIDYEMASIETHVEDLREEQEYLYEFITVPNFEDGAVIKFDSDRGLTFVAILKANQWWTTTTIGLAANRTFSDLPGLLIEFKPQRITVMRNGKSYGL